MASSGGVVIAQSELTVATTAPFTPIDIDLPVLSSSVDLHIFDVLTNDVADSVGLVTVRASTDNDSSVRVLVSSSLDSDFASAFQFPRDFREPGLRQFGGLRFLPTIGSLLPVVDRTSVSINVLGDITGDITAGQIFRVDARRTLGGTETGGRITGNITSNKPNGLFGFDGGQEIGYAIGYVRAGWELTGNITASLNQAERDAFNLNNPQSMASIGRVVVGPDENAPGIRGNIIGDYGRVDAVYSTGQIGTSSAPVLIRGGTRVGLVKARTETDQSGNAPLDKDFFVTVDASARGVAESAVAGAALRLIETEGDFIGNVNLLNYSGFNGEFGNEGTRATGRRGIFVGGNFVGDINVTYNWEYGDMVARSFRGDITIGQMLKGAIVAVGTQGSSDPLDGIIESVTIGYQEDLTLSPTPDNGRGFTGCGFSPSSIVPPPFEGTSREVWYTGPSNDTSGAIIDSVIRADKRIDSVDIYRISKSLSVLGGKNTKPRIETPVIGSLNINRFDMGAVWSGKINSTTSTVTNQITDDFTSVSTVTIGCMSPAADLWVKDFSLATFNNFFGELHTPSLAANQVIRIDGKFGEIEGALVTTGCATTPLAGQVPEEVLLVEDSPRGLWTDIETSASQTFERVGNAEFGRIVLRDPNSLAGQITVDAANTTAAQRPSTHMLGDVIVGSSAASPEVFSTNAARATTGNLGPAYTAFPATFGGGAVGLVPFGVHWA